MAQDLPAMSEGGAWVSRGGAPPVYVVHEAHIKRLVSEGGLIVPDPREGPVGEESGSNARVASNRKRAAKAEAE